MVQSGWREMKCSSEGCPPGPSFAISAAVSFASFTTARDSTALARASPQLGLQLLEDALGEGGLDAPLLQDAQAFLGHVAIFPDVGDAGGEAIAPAHAAARALTARRSRGIAATMIRLARQMSTRRSSAAPKPFCQTMRKS